MARSEDDTIRAVEAFAKAFDAVTANVAQILRGKEEQVALATMSLLAGGHVLLEDVPGVGKTTLAKALAVSFGLDWGRIQFTPDLLPSDVTGVNIFDREGGDFQFRAGPVFTNVLLGDEINRASPKAQAALLEAMQERQVTVDGTTYGLPDPFMVIATQNPVDHQGTYPLPEAQLDRFLVRLGLGYPGHDAEVEMLALQDEETSPEDLRPAVTPSTLGRMAQVLGRIHVAPSIRHYVVDLAEASRRRPELVLGMSPRAAIALQKMGRARAAASGREFVIPDDIKAMAGPVLEHRLQLNPAARAQGQTVTNVLAAILASVSPPRDGRR